MKRRNKAVDEKNMIEKIASAFRDTAIYKKIASCVLIVPLLVTLQSTSAMAQDSLPAGNQKYNLSTHFENFNNILRHKNRYFNVSATVNDSQKKLDLMYDGAHILEQIQAHEFQIRVDAAGELGTFKLQKLELYNARLTATNFVQIIGHHAGGFVFSDRFEVRLGTTIEPNFSEELDYFIIEFDPRTFVQDVRFISFTVSDMQPSNNEPLLNTGLMLPGSDSEQPTSEPAAIPVNDQPQTAGTTSFKDVEDHWARDAINNMGSRLIINGSGDGNFQPNLPITRAEFADVLVKGLGLMRPGTGKTYFKDVNEGAMYYDAVSIAYENNLITGYNGLFRPMELMTREEAMTMICRAMEITGLKADISHDQTNIILDRFKDSCEVSGWARESISSCIEAGILEGKGEKNLAPRDKITRAEVAVVVERLLKKSNLID